MKTCSTCGHQIKEPIDKITENVFIFTFMSIFCDGLVLFNAPEWTVVWWTTRYHILAVFVGMPVIAAYWWYRYFAEKRHARDAA